MSSTAYRALSLILFLLGIFGLLVTSTEAMLWSQTGGGLVIIFGCITAICFWASGIFFERGFLAGGRTTPMGLDWGVEDAYETQHRNSIMPKSIANTPSRRRLVD